MHERANGCGGRVSKMRGTTGGRRGRRQQQLIDHVGSLKNRAQYRSFFRAFCAGGLVQTTGRHRARSGPRRIARGNRDRDVISGSSLAHDDCTGSGTQQRRSQVFFPRTQRQKPAEPPETGASEQPQLAQTIRPARSDPPLPEEHIRPTAHHHVPESRAIEEELEQRMV